MNDVGAEIRVYGRVQGVGYRQFCIVKARVLGLSGWVRNLPDDSVAVYAEGDRGSIEVLIADLKVGPRAASVEDVVVQWTKFTGEHKTFTIAW
jgi:acylphosphatase